MAFKGFSPAGLSLSGLAAAEAAGAFRRGGASGGAGRAAGSGAWAARAGLAGALGADISPI
jgi:hypothetical protein